MSKYKPKITRTGVEQLLKKVRSEHKILNLSGADFKASDWSDLNFTSDEYDGLFNSQILGADFRNVKLIGSNFYRVDLAGTNLRGTDLTDSNLEGSNLYTALLQSSIMKKSNLRGANLVSAELVDVELDETSFAGARFGRTAIGGVDLSKGKELDEAVHVYPSLIDILTLRKTATGLRDATSSRQSEVLRFLSNVGIDDELLAVFRTWIAKPVEFYSVFISHSSLDKDFARKLYGDLRSLGVNCWYDEHQILPGARILDEIDRGIRIWDKLLLVCSINSLTPKTGWWVEQEIERALRKERESQSSTGNRESSLVPITIDNYVFDELNSPIKATILERSVGDFRNWHDTQKYANALNRIVLALGRKNAG